MPHCPPAPPTRDRKVPQAVECTIGTPQELGLDGEPPRCPPLSDGRTLTLEFDESPIDGMESTVLIRQVKVWDGPVLLQSITAGSVLEDGLHLYEGLYRLPDADKVPGAPDLRDLNGDGSADLGLLVNCGFPHNVNYAHFLWNEAMGQLVFSGLFLPPWSWRTQAAWWRRSMSPTIRTSAVGTLSPGTASPCSPAWYPGGLFLRRRARSHPRGGRPFHLFQRGWGLEHRPDPVP